jgi:hypothetical protein
MAKMNKVKISTGNASLEPGVFLFFQKNALPSPTPQHQTSLMKHRKRIRPDIQ